MSRAVPKKSVLWVRHRIRWIRNRTSDEEVIKKRRLRNQRENKRKENEDDRDDDREMEVKVKEMYVFIKVTNIHFNPLDKLAFKSNSFSCNLVLNCNSVRKLIANSN